MEFNVIDNKDKTVIRFNKDKLLGTEGVEFQNSVLNTLDKGVQNIVVDLSTVEYVTSWAIGMLVHAFTTSINRHAKFSLTGVSDRVNEILSKVRLNTVFEIHS